MCARAHEAFSKLERTGLSLVPEICKVQGADGVVDRDMHFAATHTRTYAQLMSEDVRRIHTCKDHGADGVVDRSVLSDVPSPPVEQVHCQPTVRTAFRSASNQMPSKTSKQAREAATRCEHEKRLSDTNMLEQAKRQRLLAYIANAQAVVTNAAAMI